MRARAAKADELEAASSKAADDRKAAEEILAEAALARSDAERLVENAALETAAARALASAPTPELSPRSAQLEPVATARPDGKNLVVGERVVVRRAAETLMGGIPAPLFHAKARVLPGGERVSAKPAEQSGGERRPILIAKRVLHDRVLYEPNTSPQVTYAQYLALRHAGATEDSWHLA